MKSPVVVIAGSGFEARLAKTNGKVLKSDNEFGRVDCLVSEHAGRTIYAVMRHGADHTILPHKVNYKANLRLAKNVEAGGIFASTAVGVITPPTYQPRDLILCRDFIALNVLLEGKVPTNFESFADGNPHTDFSEPFSRKLNGLLLSAGAELSIPLKSDAILAVTYGPRFETPAEVRALRALGADLTGMTAVFESIFARELGIPYAPIAIGTNLAAGLGDPLSHAEVIEVMRRKGEDVFNLIMRAIEMM